MGYRDRDVRTERARHQAKSHFGWRKPQADKDDDKRRAIGGNGAPDYDPEAPPTRFLVLRDTKEFVTQDRVRISSRSQLRAYESERGVKQIGNDWGDGERPDWYDGWNDKRKRRKRDSEVQA